MSRSVLASLAAAAALAVSGSAQASILMYNVVFSGANESPPNASTGTGVGLATIDTTQNTMRLQATFSGLLGTTTASHIHCCTAVPSSGTAGVATMTPSFTGFPLGVTAGAFDRTFDLTQVSSYNFAFITANGGTTASAEAALLAGIDAGKAYWNIHTSFAPGGEIRGFFSAATSGGAGAVPEPQSWALMIMGFGAAGAMLRRRRLAVAPSV